jgi:hypothetical protein
MGKWRNAVPLPILIEDPISAIDPLALLGTFEGNSSSIKVPKRLNCLFGTFYISWIPVRASVPPQIVVFTDHFEGAFGQQ